MVHFTPVTTKWTLRNSAWTAWTSWTSWTLVITFCIIFTQIQHTHAQADKKYAYNGCYKHSPDTWDFAWSPPERKNYTALDCSPECERNGYEKAGVMNGAECRCSNHPLGEMSQSCDTPCVAMYYAMCGGKESLLVFATDAVAEESRFVGCWKRKLGQVLIELPESQVADTDLPSCIVNCRKALGDAPLENLVVGINNTHCVCGQSLHSAAVFEETHVCAGCFQGSGSCPSDFQMLNIYTPECPEKTYGKLCSPCNCHGDEKCDVTTGSCPGACADGWLADPVACSKVCEHGTFGPMCTNYCHCADSAACDPATGSCPSNLCMPGYTGTSCSHVCDSGSFGESCAGICNCLNSTECDPFNGTCPFGLCPDGWSGPTCHTRITTIPPDIETSTTNEITSTSTVEVIEVAKEIVPVQPEEEEVFEPDVYSSPWSNHAAASGGGGAAVAVLVIIVAVVCYVRYRRKHRGKMRAYEARMQYLRDNNSCTSLLNESPLPSKSFPNDSIYSSPSTTGSPSMTSSLGTPGTPGKALRFRMTPQEFIIYFQQRQLNNDALAAEFSMLKRGQLHRWKSAASNPNRKQFNRLANVLPFDYNRVILEDQGESESDYINASYIKNHDGENNFIATQGPSQETVCNFWKMVWNCDVKYIVMLTRLVEAGRSKCIRYWPAIEGHTAEYENNLQIRMVDEDHWPDFVIRKFIISKDEERREVIHYQFKGWPDMGVPKYTMPFMVFIQLVRSQRTVNSGRSVVHCSTGTARTGIFLATDILWDQLVIEEELDVPTCVQQLREQRINMVQTLDQYTFIYQMMFESLTLGTRSYAGELKEKYERMKEEYPGIIEKQYQILENLDEAKSQEVAVNLNDSGRGSVSDLISNVPEVRPMSQSSSHSLSISQYIPVDGYFTKKSYLISRFPGLNDPLEFWSAIHDNNSRIIVAFSSSAGCWPSHKGTSETYGIFGISCVGHSTTKSQDVKMHHIVLELSTYDNKENRFVDVYQADIEGPLSLDFLELHSHLQYAKEVTRSTAPIVVHNSSNYQIAGVLCAFNVIAEMLDSENEVDVFLAVQRVRSAVPFFIDTVKVYQHLHDLAASYTNSENKIFGCDF